jgi:WD40 repeat protein
VYSLAFNPDGKLLASGSKDATARIWDVQEQKLVKVLTEHIIPILFYYCA